MASYQDSSELLAAGMALIKKHHPDLASLNIGFLFRDAATISRGHITMGMAVKVDDRNHIFNGKDVIIEIARDVWDRLDDELKVVLMDHELSFIGVELDDKGSTVLTSNGRPKVFIKHPDVSEFSTVLDRYGDTHKRFRSAVEAMCVDLKPTK